jgi:SagB-type dehydrogenase family enzyme
VVLALRAALGRAPSRFALNVETSLLLATYYLITAALGVFWVQNQQLPPFDWHYLFGYATTLLFAVHLAFNLRLVVRHFAKAKSSEPHARVAWTLAKVLRWGSAVAALVLAYALGVRSGTRTLSVPPGDGGRPHAGSASEQAIRDYHAFSSHSRQSVLTRAPSVAWGERVDPYLDRANLPRVPLEAMPPSGESRALGEASLLDVTALVWSAAGITERRGGFDLRAAASSGALFPSEIYVAAWNVRGLDAGLYAYAPNEHALAKLPASPLDLRALGAAEVQASLPPFALVLSSVFRRTGQKYRDRAYRYAAADAGHALGNAVAVAQELGFAPEFAHRFDDARLGRAFGWDAAEEEGLAILALRPRGALPREAPQLFQHTPLEAADRLPFGVTSFAHRATSLTLETADTEAQPAADASTRALPPLERGDAGVLRALAHRRSLRTFDSGTLALAEVGAVLGRSVALEPALLSRSVRVFLSASRVDALEPGIYRYHPSAHALSRVNAGDQGPRLGSAALGQAAIGEAPAVVVLTLDRRTLEQEGPRGYRHAFLEAGLTGARLYLAAQAAGLGGCAVGAFYDDELRAVLGMSETRAWPVHLFGFGRPGS